MQNGSPPYSPVLFLRAEPKSPDPLRRHRQCWAERLRRLPVTAFKIKRPYFHCWLNNSRFGQSVQGTGVSNVFNIIWLYIDELLHLKENRSSYKDVNILSREVAILYYCLMGIIKQKKLWKIGSEQLLSLTALSVIYSQNTKRPSNSGKQR